jgi:hypothetical protein
VIRWISNILISDGERIFAKAGQILASKILAVLKGLSSKE